MAPGQAIQADKGGVPKVAALMGTPLPLPLLLPLPLGHPAAEKGLPPGRSTAMDAAPIHCHCRASQLPTKTAIETVHGSVDLVFAHRRHAEAEVADVMEAGVVLADEKTGNLQSQLAHDWGGHGTALGDLPKQAPKQTTWLSRHKSNTSDFTQKNEQQKRVIGTSWENDHKHASTQPDLQIT